MSSFSVAGLLTANSAIAQQGGTGYIKKGHLRGKNNPDEPRFKIVDQLSEETISPGCTGRDKPVTYMAYKIRCPNYPGGGNHNEVSAADHKDGCPGGSGGRRIYLNSDRNVETNVEDVYEFVRRRQCWEPQAESAEGHDKSDGHDTKYYQVTFRPA